MRKRFNLVQKYYIFADLEPESEDVRKLMLPSVEEMWGEERQEAGEEVEEAPDR